MVSSHKAVGSWQNRTWLEKSRSPRGDMAFDSCDEIVVASRNDGGAGDGLLLLAT